jgi:hypothetical protein
MAMTEHTMNLEYHILLHNTSILTKKKILSPSSLLAAAAASGTYHNMRKDNSLSCSRSWKPFIHSLNEGMKTGPPSKDKGNLVVLFPWLSQGTAFKTQSALFLPDGLSGSSFMVFSIRASPVFCS